MTAVEQSIPSDVLKRVVGRSVVAFVVNGDSFHLELDDGQVLIVQGELQICIHQTGAPQ